MLGLRDLLLTFLMQKVEGVPDSYMALRGVILDLVKELEGAREAGKHFKADFAQKVLDELLELVIEAAMETSRCYSHGKIGAFFSFRRFTSILIP